MLKQIVVGVPGALLTFNVICALRLLIHCGMHINSTIVNPPPFLSLSLSPRPSWHYERFNCSCSEVWGSLNIVWARARCISLLFVYYNVAIHKGMPQHTTWIWHNWAHNLWPACASDTAGRCKLQVLDEKVRSLRRVLLLLSMHHLYLY